MSAQDDAKKISGVFGLPAEAGKDANGNDSIIVHVGTWEEATELFKKTKEIRDKLGLTSNDVTINANTREGGAGAIEISLNADPAREHTQAERDAVVKKLEQGKDQFQAAVQEAYGPKVPDAAHRQADSVGKIFGLPAEVGSDDNKKDAIVVHVGSWEEATSLWKKAVEIRDKLGLTSNDVTIRANTSEGGVGALVISLNTDISPSHTEAEKDAIVQKLEKGTAEFQSAVREAKGGRASNKSGEVGGVTEVASIAEALSKFRQDPHSFPIGENVSPNSVQARSENNIRTV